MRQIVVRGRRVAAFGLTVFLMMACTGVALGQRYVFTTIAGQVGMVGSNNGTGTAALFSQPFHLSLDASTNLYVVDNGNSTIRRITPAGAVTTYTGNPTTVGTNNGVASAARFNGPIGVVASPDGNIYSTDTGNDTVRWTGFVPFGHSGLGILQTGTLAGQPGTFGTANGTGSVARFDAPCGITADTSSNLYVADFDNSSIRKITPAGVVTTFAGQTGTIGTNDGLATSAKFSRPEALAFDKSSLVFTMYVADTYNHTIRVIGWDRDLWNYKVSTVAGQPGVTGTNDGVGATARFCTPRAIAVDNSGNLFVADTGNQTIRKLTHVGTNWVVTTVGGLGGTFGHADGVGTVARFHFPQGIAVDAAGNLYVSDSGNNTIRKGRPITTPGDVDKDNKTDLMLYHPQSGNWYIRLSSNLASRVVQWGWAETVPVPGDYDGDGKIDLAVYHPGTGNWYILRSSDGVSVTSNFGWSETVPVPGDYDGDGKTDVAVYHPSTGNWYIRRSSDGVGVTIHLGWSETIPVPGDYDGDGKTDLAVYHPGTGNWYILRSSDGVVVTTHLGWSETMPVPGDYDGDGITDLAVYHPQTGTWYIQQSSNSAGYAIPWGWSEAMPVPGDYDGDGKTDLAVYHPESGYWYIRKSSDLLWSVSQWGWSETIPAFPQYQINQSFGFTPLP